MKYAEENFYSLAQVLETVGAAVQKSMPDRFWVVAEIASVSHRNHVYIELIEKDRSTGKVVAKVSSAVWAGSVASVIRPFTAATGKTLEAGMSLLLCVSVRFTSVYGLNLNIHAIDGDFTLGEMARQKRETIDRLNKEGLLDCNKALDFPLVPQRIAIVSSASAAGYGDFVHQLENNRQGYYFTHTLFEAAMQGDGAEQSIIKALRSAAMRSHEFDLLLLIRGGGSKVDLHYFDGYALARELAIFPLPVITGIGHERDESVADMVASVCCKTPTAVAEFCIRCVSEFDNALQELQNRIMRGATTRLETCRNLVETAMHKMRFGTVSLVAGHRQELNMLQEGVRTGSLHRLERETGFIDRTAEKIRLLDPVNVLKRGYSLVYKEGTLVKTIGAVAIGDKLDIRVSDGSLTAVVDEISIAKEGDTPDAL